MSRAIHTDLLAEISAFCEQHGLSRSAFGLRMMNDPCFVADLEEGRELRRSTIAKVKSGMAAAMHDRGAA